MNTVASLRLAPQRIATQRNDLMRTPADKFTIATPRGATRRLAPPRNATIF